MLFLSSNFLSILYLISQIKIQKNPRDTFYINLYKYFTSMTYSTEQVHVVCTRVRPPSLPLIA